MNTNELRVYLQQIIEKCEREMKINEGMCDLNLEELSRQELTQLAEILLKANKTTIERSMLLCNSYNACLDVIEAKYKIESQPQEEVESDTLFSYMGKNAES